MNFTFENQGTNTFLVYTLNPDDVIDSLSLGMITNNKIFGLASTIFTQMDTTKYIKYNISSKVSVANFLSGIVNKKRLLGVFNGIVDALMSAEEYMIDRNSIVFDLNYMFSDVSTCETILICVPLVDTSYENVDYLEFFKKFIFNAHFDQTENCDYVAKILNYLNSTPVFSLTEFKELLISCQGGPGASNVASRIQTKAPVQQPAVVSAQPAAVKKTVPVAVQAPVAPQTAPIPNQQVQPIQPRPEMNGVQAPQKTYTNQAMNQPVNNMPVPNMNAPVQSSQQNVSTEKPMSLFYLLQHYNSENAAIYKAQKEAKKAGNAAPARPAQPAAPKAGFAVPGQPAQPVGPKAGFAVPGQPVPQPAPKTGFAMPSQKTPVNAAPAMPAQPAAPVQPQPAAAPVYQAPVMPQSQPMNFGETTVLGGGGIGETTVLGATPAVAPTPHLIRTKNNEKINLNKPVFRIGKEKSYVDYFIGDNTAISRSHANIVTRDGEYFAVDTNSTNHTYVNGNMIPSNTEAKLNHGDKVRLANEDFEFRLY